MTALALVTGGAKGIGSAITTRLAETGYEVVVTGRDHAALTDQVARLADRDLIGHARVMDVSDPESVRVVFEEIVAELGPVDVLVNCAGIISRGPAEDYSDDDWLRVVNTDLNGVFWCTRAAVGPMLAAGRGSIINIGSIVGNIGIPGRASYAAAKAGLGGLTRTLAVEWASRGVRVNTVAAGWTLTEMVAKGIESGRLDQNRLIGRIPMGRLARTDEIASVVQFLSSDAASYITGEVITVDGGYTINGQG